MYRLVQPNQVIHYLLHIIFILRIKLWIFKQSTWALYASEISLFNFFINACKLTGELPIDWSFFLGVWHSVNSLSVNSFIICNRLKFILAIDTVSLSLTKIYLYTDGKIVVLVQHWYFWFSVAEPFGEWLIVYL